MINRTRPNQDPRSVGAKHARRAAVSLLAGVVAVTSAGSARAEEVSPKGKGIVGGALLGAEVVVMVESLAGVHKGLWYGVGAGVGAAGGGVGGYFIEQGSSDGRVPMYMLAGGLALVIPAIVLTLNATRYQPDLPAVEDRSPGAPANPGVPGGSVIIQGGSGAVSTPPATTPAAPSGPGATPPSTTTPAPTPAPGPPRVPESLLDVNHDGNQSQIRLGVPVPHVAPMWSQREQKVYGLQQGSELRVPVLKVTF